MMKKYQEPVTQHVIAKVSNVKKDFSRDEHNKIVTWIRSFFGKQDLRSHFTFDLTTACEMQPFYMIRTNNGILAYVKERNKDTYTMVTLEKTEAVRKPMVFLILHRNCKSYIIKD